MGLKFSVEKGHIFYPQEAWLNIFLCMDNTTNVHDSEQLVFCSHRPQATLHHPQRAFISHFSTLRSSLIPSSLWIKIYISFLLKRTNLRLQNLLESLGFRSSNSKLFEKLRKSIYIWEWTTLPSQRSMLPWRTETAGESDTKPLFHNQVCCGKWTPVSGHFTPPWHQPWQLHEQQSHSCHQQQGSDCWAGTAEKKPL